MGIKFYAIKKGIKTGIYTNWDECKKNITGYSGAEYKSFTNIQDAENYLKDNEQTTEKIVSNATAEAIAYVDGSSNTEKISIFIDKDSIDEIITKIGNEEWSDFKSEKLIKVGNVYRCVFYIGDNKALLNFYFKNDGTTTISPTGNNIEFSQRLKQLIEQNCKYKDTGISKHHSLIVSNEWVTKLIDFMQNLSDVEMTYNNTVQLNCIIYQFKSNIGDKITFNIYDTGSLVIQGKPAYLYSEAISFLSYCPEITISDILETTTKFQNIDIKVNDIKDEIKILMPTAYDNIDNTIIKILSPSLTLKKVELDLDDYSCYAFPALRALEGYLKYLFDLKNIVVNHKFGDFYDYNKNNNQYYLKKSIQNKISNTKMQIAMEKIYNYFYQNRHTLFHTEQILISSRILENKQEADLIINEVINMIESTCNDINNQ